MTACRAGCDGRTVIQIHRIIYQIQQKCPSNLTYLTKHILIFSYTLPTNTGRHCKRLILIDYRLIQRMNSQKYLKAISSKCRLDGWRPPSLTVFPTLYALWSFQNVFSKQSNQLLGFTLVYRF